MAEERGQGKYNVVVIGAGTAGLVTAAATSGLGGRVALVERHKMGGDCLNYGCVPSKALVRSAKLVHDLRRGAEFGLRPMEIGFDLQDVFSRMRERRAVIEPHDSRERFEKLGVDVFLGQARFTSGQEVEVNGTRLRARNFVIATGSSPAVPPVPGLDKTPFYTNETIFDQLRSTPRSLMVLGGGPIGCELAQVMARLAVQVTVVELLDRLLPRDDPEAGALLQSRFQAEGIRVLTGAKAVDFRSGPAGVEATVERGGEYQRLAADALLVATGRQPNIEGLGLEAAGVEFDRRGIQVEASLATSQPHIYACGDVVGPLQFTHTADYQARIVTRNILFPWLKARVDYQWIPRVTYTDPEVAQAGLTQEEARAAGVDYRLHRFEWGELDRAILDREEQGFIKAITAAGRDRLLGVTVVGAHAGEVLAGLGLAGKHGIGLAKISATVHAYPSYAQSAQRVADVYMRSRLTPRVLSLFRALYRWRRR
jgi:pyruvate/2-oxoglutarate dehydrogenase complex dihydrolipoamide dehydrogenase (E3) component